MKDIIKEMIIVLLVKGFGVSEIGELVNCKVTANQINAIKTWHAGKRVKIKK